MLLRTLLSTLLLSLAAAPSAFAGDQVVDLSSGTGSFIGTAALFDGGDDVITFVNLPAGSYDFWLSVSAQHVTGLTALLNGVPASVLTPGVFSFAYLEGTDDAPFVLTLTGTPGAQANYSGELSVRLVPEPGTLALLGVGLAGMATGGRHRRA